MVLFYPSLCRNYEAELLHARWAMLGAVGCLIPEALTIFGGVELGEPVWWKVGSRVRVSGLWLGFRVRV